MAEEKYNLRNPAVKRILQEMREMEKDDSLDFVAQAFEENIFEWHFVIRGPPDTDFEGGLYHGRILLPSEYPMKPPSFMMLTKNGRFETNTKICLSISDYHPEHWQPSWSMRTALTALVAFLPTPGKGALGSIDMSSDIRKQLAALSRREIVEFGTEERKKLARELHEKLVQRLSQATSSKKATSSRRSSIHTLSELSGKHENIRASTRGAAVREPNGDRVTDGRQAERVHRAGTSSDWIWTSLTYVLGFLILAIITKKILTTIGLANFASPE